MIYHQASTLLEMKDADNNCIRIRSINADFPGLTETLASPRKGYHNFTHRTVREKVSACFTIRENVRFCELKYILCPHRINSRMYVPNIKCGTGAHMCCDYLDTGNIQIWGSFDPRKLESKV